MKNTHLAGNWKGHENLKKSLVYILDIKNKQKYVLCVHVFCVEDNSYLHEYSEENVKNCIPLRNLLLESQDRTEIALVCNFEIYPRFV